SIEPQQPPGRMNLPEFSRKGAGRDNVAQPFELGIRQERSGCGKLFQRKAPHTSTDLLPSPNLTQRHFPRTVEMTVPAPQAHQIPPSIPDVIRLRPPVEQRKQRDGLALRRNGPGEGGSMPVSIGQELNVVDAGQVREK